jgi:hypothetical protein
MTEWLREGIEGRNLKATLRLYLFGLMALAPAAVALALIFGAQTSVVATPLLVLLMVAVEYAICYRERLFKDLGKLHWIVGPLVEYKDLRGPSKSLRRVLSPDSANIGEHIAASIDDKVVESDDKIVERLGHSLLADEASVRAEAATALGAIGDGRAVDRLINALQDKEAKVRYRVAVALMEIGDLRAVEPLVSAMGDASVSWSVTEALQKKEHTVIAREVIEALRRMGNIDKSQEPPLTNKDVSTPTGPIRKRA